MAGSIAAQVMAWQRRTYGAAGPLSASGEASNGEPVQIEIWVNGQWIDITAYVMVRDDQGRISITSGIRDEGSQTEQSRSTLPLRNDDGRFTRRNPTGPYYGYIGRNTPARISVPDGMGGKSYRQWPEISKWPKQWDPTGTDVWVDVSADGLLQRLSQAPPPERSLLYNAITTMLTATLVAYWPGEDTTGIRLASALSTGSPMTRSGTLTLASYEAFGASDPLPDLTTASLSGGVAEYADPTATQVRFLASIPTAGLSDGKVLAAIDQLDYSAGSTQFWELYYSTTSNSLTLRTCASDGTNLGAELPHTLDVRGLNLYVSVELAESGTGITRALRLTDVDKGIVYSAADTATLTQLTRVMRLQFGPASRSVVGPIGSQFLPGVAIGHATVENAITATDILGVRLNPVGERAGRRIQRLCADNGIPFDWVGDLDDTVAMGAQTKQNPLALIQEAVLADGGLLYENRAVLGLGYRTRTSLYNQDPALTLDYTGYNLSDIPTPVEDDRYLANRVVVTAGGVTATYEETDGPLSTAPPPAGVGVYGANSESPLSLNLAASDTATLRNQAAWRVHLGTVDEDRFPQISVNLAHQSFVNNPAMRRAVLALRLGDRVQITNPPPWVGPDTIDQIVLGMEEEITHFEHRITLVCQPASPYSSMGVLNAARNKADTSGSELAAAVASGATSLSVSVTDGPAWVTDAGQFPFDIRCGGEVMTVTAISGSSSPQTFTVTRSVNGVVKAQTVGTRLRLAYPMTIALSAGDRMPYPTILAGQDVTAELLTSMLPTIVVKAATEPITASTTMQNDDELFATVAANATYDVLLHLLYDSATAGDITIGWTAPASAVMTWGLIGAQSGETSSSTVANVNMQTRTILEAADLGGGASTGTYGLVHGTLITAATAGTLNFQWAQRVSSATASNVRAGSVLMLHRTA